MRHISLIKVAVALFAFRATICSTSTCFCDEPLPHEYRDKIESMPDFCQGDERFGAFPGHGSELCAPTALSNAFVWLNGHGFPKVMGKSSIKPADQAKLIRKLCSAEFWNSKGFISRKGSTWRSSMEPSPFRPSRNDVD